jgi:hypothetical protein
METKEKQDSTELFFPEWTEEVKSLVELNRKRFEASMPNYRVFTVIVNEDQV